MNSPLVLAAVTAALENLLENGLVDHAVTAALGGDTAVSALPPDRVATGPDEKAQINLFLYQVSAKGLTPGSRFEGGAERANAVTSPPHSLELEYLLTAYGVDDLQTEILLGYGMAVLADAPVLSAEALGTIITAVSSQDGGRVVPPARAVLSDPALLRCFRRVKISPQALQTEEMVNLWSSFQVAYRPSIAYRVSVELTAALETTASETA